MLKIAFKKIVNRIKREVFGESARGERVVIPDLKKLHQKLDKRMSNSKVNHDFNRWCSEMNFGGMHVKKYS